MAQQNSADEKAAEQQQDGTSAEGEKTVPAEETLAADANTADQDAGDQDAGDQDAGEPIDVDDPMAVLLAERDKLKEQLLRALADTENMRRRAEREAASVRKYGHTPFARDLVGALDNLGRAVDSTPEKIDELDEAVKSLITGIQLSWTELQSVIQKHGIEPISPKGEKFDYNLHQAMFEVPTDDVPSGTVVEVIQHGYVLHDRLLRPAMVGVSKPATQDAAAANKDDKTQDKA
jgi:molecular chaperone GrpE